MPSSSLQVRDTRQNAESSRSHQIVRIFVESRPSLPTMPEGGVAPIALALTAWMSLELHNGHLLLFECLLSECPCCCWEDDRPID